jgi:type I restriction enzyme S subunit
MKNNIIQKNIPQGWQVKKLGDVCDVVSGSTPSTAVKKYWGEGHHLITPLDLSKGHKYLGKVEFKGRDITAEGFASCSTVKIPRDSVVMSSRAPIGYLTINKLDNAATNQGCKSFIIKDKIKVNTEFLYYRIIKDTNKIKQLGSGSTFLEVARKDLEKIEIRIPPIKEQKKIAEILGAVDEDIAKTQGVIEATEKLKKGLMQQLFTRGIGHTKFKKTKLGDVCIFKTGKLNSNKAVDGGQYPFFTCSQGNFAIDQYSFDQKAILLAGNNAAGNYSVKYYEGRFDAYQRTYVISVKSENELSYIYLREVLNARLDELKNSSVGSTTKFLTLNLLQNLPISLPDIVAQNKIAKIITAVNEKISINKKLKNKLTLLKKGLMQDLLSGRVRV